MSAHVGHWPELVAPEATPESGKPALAKPAPLVETPSAGFHSRSFEADRATGGGSTGRASLASTGLPNFTGGDTTARLDAKVVATLKARCALAGIELHVIAGDAGETIFIVSRWSLTRQLHSVAEVETFLRRMAGPSA